MCEKEIQYFNINDVPLTCSTHCDENYKYQQKHVDEEGKVQTPEEIEKW